MICLLFVLVRAECEACHEAIDDIKRASLDVFCSHGDFDRFCYVLEPMRAQLATWLDMKMDSRRICKRINKMNPDACTLRRKPRVLHGGIIYS